MVRCRHDVNTLEIGGIKDRGQRTMRTTTVLALTLVAPFARGDSGVEFFEKKVRPVLVEHCYRCHSEQAKKNRGGLLLDTRQGIRAGGDTGPAIVPGKPAESLLLKAVRYTEETLKMPPKGKLPDAVIADLEEWIKKGAADPRDRAATAGSPSWEEMLRNRRHWWSLQPVRRAEPPRVKNSSWSHHPVDRFLLARLEERGLTPSARADRQTLIRRLSLVLRGLPPAPDEVEAFVRDESPHALDKLVDRLLASPHFGERWARHWLDVVRFTETHGNEWNYEVHHAWRYRDYLVRAFNDDVPYDQLVREHLAGDLLKQPRWNRSEGFNESVIGTAFYRFGEGNHDDCIGLPQIGYDLADNQIDTLSKAFQAATVACARCHDHKLDAVSTNDYYALLGVLRSSRLVSHTIDAPEVHAKTIQRLRDLKQAIRKELGAVWLREVQELPQRLLARQPDKKPAQDDMLAAWRTMASLSRKDESGFAAAWRKLAERYTREERERIAHEANEFVRFDDFPGGKSAGWQRGGQGLRDGAGRAGDFIVRLEGEALVKSVLPAGCFTHALSDRLNGTLRSPVLSGTKKYISFEVLGRRSSAVRLVSNNCQLNYRNYRALTSDDWQWVTFPLPEERDNLRVYAELMTMFDNPKFPDQLSALGGDTGNYRLPWEQAAANPRSFFGVTRIVLHDGPQPPKSTQGHLLRLFDRAPPRTLADVASRYAASVETAIQSWIEDRASDADVRWIDGLLHRGLLSNRVGLTSRLEALTKQYRETEAQLSQPRVVPGIADCGPGFAQPVLVRGDCLKPGERVPRRYLEVLSRPGDQFATGESGRRELAERIASADNPLTARVMVNRIWHHLFGTGLVRTVDDFGRVGELPSHPELLDYLAARFVEEGWSIKRLIRSLVLTQTFQLSSRPSPAARAIDPLNRLLQHYPARRIEAEAIRDSILAVSGRLDRTLYGMSLPSFRETPNADRRLFPGPLDGNGRRSLYIKNTLMEAPRFLDVFDFPGGKVTQGRRDVTSVPAQALALLNDPFVLQQAEVWAGHLVNRPDPTITDRVGHLFQVALGRPAQGEELSRVEQAVAQFAELHQVKPADILRNPAVWKDVAHAFFNLKEFIYIR
ncbi:MAG: PSD1 domain-containing protein [Planctomycetes bacterium]|nr:PSD1 domain-containing protein [Planctomycetota bacterium]